MLQDLSSTAVADSAAIIDKYHDLVNKTVNQSYILDADREDDVLDDSQVSAFSPKILEFKTATMKIQPQTTMDKDRNDVFL